MEHRRFCATVFNCRFIENSACDPSADYGVDSIPTR